MQYFDTHAHYEDSRFAEEYPGGADELLKTLFAENVCGVINTATSLQNIPSVIAQAQKFPKMYTALGIHPCDAQAIDEPIDRVMAFLKEKLTDPASKAVALGEIGLDYHYDDTDKEKQLAYFHAQMQLAQSLDLPVVIHDREAHADVYDVIFKYPAVRGVLHSFSGSAEDALKLVQRGYMISFSGVLTFKNARKTVECANILPKESVLIETDCPYLAPVPHRGKLNHSGMLVYTNAVLAQCLGISESECAALTAENAYRFFSIKNS